MSTDVEVKLNPIEQWLIDISWNGNYWIIIRPKEQDVLIIPYRNKIALDCYNTRQIMAKITDLHYTIIEVDVTSYVITVTNTELKEKILECFLPIKDLKSPFMTSHEIEYHGEMITYYETLGTFNSLFIHLFEKSVEKEKCYKAMSIYTEQADKVEKILTHVPHPEAWEEIFKTPEFMMDGCYSTAVKEKLRSIPIEQKIEILEYISKYGSELGTDDYGILLLRFILFNKIYEISEKETGTPRKVNIAGVNILVYGESRSFASDLKGFMSCFTSIAQMLNDLHVDVYRGVVEIYFSHFSSGKNYRVLDIGTL